MKKILLIFIVSFVFSLNLSAQQRSFEKAERMAYNYVSKKEALIQKQIVSLCFDIERKAIERPNRELKRENAPFYIFSDSTSASFVIISGDERMKDILAVGEFFPLKGSGVLPEGLVGLFETYRQQYELLQSGTIERETENVTIDIPDIQPLIKTKWRQGVPFNNLCPAGCPSGCVATAMSQVMNYHQFPSSGHGAFSYTSYTRGYKCSYDFENAIFYWDKLKKSYSNSTLGDISGTDEIAQVTYACGVSVGMDYDKGGSGAYLFDVPYALINFFGYNANVSYRDRTCYSSSDWYNMLGKELVEGRPVIYGGHDRKNGGHAFIIEGYNSKTKKFYVNWGWGGDYDGEYELDALDPNSFRFSSYQSMIVNVSPQLVGDYGDYFYADKFIAPKEIVLDKNLKFTIYDLKCYTSQSSYVVPSAKFNGEVGVALFDKDFNYMSSLGSKDVQGLNSYDGFEKLDFTAKLIRDLFPENGTYYIAPYAKAKSSVSPTRIRTSGGKTDYIIVTVSEEDISGNEDEERPEEAVSAWSEDFEYTAVPKGWSQQSELGESLWKHRYVLLPSEDMPIAAKGKGYIFLEYVTNMNDRYNTRTVTRLETKEIPLAENVKYELSFQCRKYATLPESTDLITVYYEKDNEWHMLSEIPIKNQGEWNKVTIQLPEAGHLKLAFEGSPSKGAFVFLDDLLINECQDKTDIRTFFLDISEKATVYSLMGVKQTHLRTGINIVKKPDGKTIKILSK